MNKLISAALYAALGFAFAVTGIAFAQPAPVTVTPVQLGQTGIATVNIGSQNLELQELNISWARPTTRANGNTLAATEIASYKLYLMNGAVSNYRVKTVAGKYLSTKIKQPLCTTFYYAITAIDTGGLESVFSNIISVKTYCPNS